MTTANEIIYITGDLFTSTQPALGHGVNTEGQMNSGIAPIFKNKFPTIFDPYVTACETGALKGGGVLPIKVDTYLTIYNIASQEAQGRNANIAFLEQGVTAAFIHARENKISGMALPRIGAGIGGLIWEDVNETLQRVKTNFPDVELELWTLPQ